MILFFTLFFLLEFLYFMMFFILCLFVIVMDFLFMVQKSKIEKTNKRAWKDKLGWLNPMV